MIRPALDVDNAGWLKSSYSNDDGGACVEVAPGHGHIPVRDSKDTSVGHVVVAPAAWSALLSRLRTA